MRCCLATLFILLLGTAMARAGAPGSDKGRGFVVMAYNVENLFDVDRVSRFEDYVEEENDPNSYGPAKLLAKLEGIRRVLASVAGGAGPDVLLLCELEIDFTPESRVGDLRGFLREHAGTTTRQMLAPQAVDSHRGIPSEAWLLKHLVDSGLTGYQVVVGEDSPQAKGRGDIAHKNVILSRLPVVESRTHPTAGARGVVEAVLDAGGPRLHVFANHWKSGAGAEAAEEVRKGNARVLRRRLDEILEADPNAEVIIGGDLNSHYNHRERHPRLGTTGIQDVLGAQGDKAALGRPHGPSLYNLWHELPVERRYSDEFNGEWGTLMHLIVSRGLLDGRGIEYVDGSFKPWILPGTNAQPPLGLPWRWTSLGTGAGTSDHFPLVATFRLQAAPMARVLSQEPGMARAPAQALSVGYERIDPSLLRSASVLSKATPAELASAIGEIFDVEGTMASGRAAAVSVAGRRYLLHSFDRALRESLQGRKPGERVHVIGELGRYKGQFQFVIHHRSWLTPNP